MKIQFITVQEVDIHEGDLLEHHSILDNDYYIFSDTGVGFTLISLQNGNRYADPCSKEELKAKIEEDGRFTFFGKINFGSKIQEDDLVDI